MESSILSRKAILSPTHEMVDMINGHMLDLIEGDEMIYQSSDSVSLDDADTNFDESIYTISLMV